MSIEQENKAVVRRFWEEVFNTKNLDVADEICSSDHVVHFPSLSLDAVGPEAMKGLVAMHCKLYPDIEVAVEAEVAVRATISETHVVTSWTARGTLADELRSVDSDDDEVEVSSGVNIYRVSDGQITESVWWQFDTRVDESQTPREEFRKFLLDDTLDDPVSRHAREFFSMGDDELSISDDETVSFLKVRRRPICCLMSICC